MYIKGEIGEEVYIKAKIVSAEVFENTANYKVNIRHTYNLDSKTFTVNEKDITFIEACETEEAQPEVKAASRAASSASLALASACSAATFSASASAAMP